MPSPKKRPSAKSSERAALAAQGAPEPTSSAPWTSKGVAINLSQSRREALRAFADSSGQSLTPAQALYALIDLIEPAASSQEPAVATPEPGQEESALHEGSPPADHFLDRLSSIEADARDTKHALASCALALEDIAAAMAPIRDLIAALSRTNETLPSLAATDSKPGAGALGAKEWLGAAIEMAGASPHREIVFALRLAERRKASGNRLALTLQARLIEVDKVAWKERATSFPALALSVDDGCALAVCLSIEPRADLAMRCERGADGAWRASVRLRIGPTTYGPVLRDLAL